MNRLLFSLTVLVCLGGNSAWAGLYNLCEPEEGKLGNPDLNPRAGSNFMSVFRPSLLTLRTIGMDNVEYDNPLRKRYFLAEQLMFAPASRLTVEQKLNLGAVLIRRKKLDAALTILRPLADREKNNFLVLANLATAYQLSGQDHAQRAISTLEDALQHWPARMSDLPEEKQKYLASLQWHDGAYEFYREVEKYQLKLLKLRAREARTRPNKTDDFDSVDALFDVKFVGESGKFEPGRIARAEQAKLPKRAIDIVQQLLVWLSDDIRLYWLLGELLNAQGDIVGARSIFEELVREHKVRAQDVREHRTALLAAEVPDPTDRIAEPLPDSDDQKQDQGMLPNTRTLLVGFGGGLVVGIFLMWQLREMRRRRSQRRPV